MKPPNETYQKAALYKSLWEQRYPGETFALIGMVFKWAKELVEVDNDLIVERFKIFANDEWYGENTRHSLPAFVKNFNSFVPKTRRKDGTWKRSEPVPIESVKELFEKIGQPMTVEKKKTDPNEKFRCPDCNVIHARGFDCHKEVPTNHFHQE